MKYPKQRSLAKYFGDNYFLLDRIHNSIKHGDFETLKKYQVYLKPRRRKNNGHKSRLE